MNTKRNTNTNKEKVTGRKKAMIGLKVVNITTDNQVEMVKTGKNLDGNEVTLKWNKPVKCFTALIGESPSEGMKV